MRGAIRIFRLFIPFEKAICATSPIRDMMVPCQNLGCITRSQREKTTMSSCTLFPRPNVFGLAIWFDQSHSKLSVFPVAANISLTKLHFFGAISSRYSSGISATNRLAILLEYVPNVKRSLARVIMSFFFARVMAT